MQQHGARQVIPACRTAMDAGPACHGRQLHQ